MSDLVRRDSEAIVGFPCVLSDGSAFVLPAVTLANSAGTPAPAGTSADPIITAGGQTALPTENSASSYVTQTPQKTFRCGFESAVASGVDTAFFTAIKTGTGMGVSQASGSLVLTSGTTTYSETILRSVSPFSAGLTLRYSMNLSQRIANQQFYIELVDVIGDALAYTINSATSVTVTIPGTTFTSANAGQSVYLGAFTTASTPGGRYAIASVAGTAVTFTVSGFPASGTGTCSAFGWNFQHIVYDGTTATTCLYDAGRNGYSSGDTTATINTTASPGHIGIVATRDATSGFLDQLSASSITIESALRASRVRNIPEDLTALRIQIRCINLSSAPASTTTLSVGFLEVESFVAQQVSLVNVGPMSLNAPLPVQVSNSPTVVAGNTAGTAAHSAAATGNPVRVGGRVNTAVETTLVAGDASDLFATTGGAQVVKQYAVPEVDWQASSGVTALATTTSTALKAAGAAGVRNYCTGVQLYNNSATVSTTVSILDGSTVIWTGFLPATTAALPVVAVHAVFPTPLRGTAATAMNIQLGTTSASVYYNAQGYQAP